MAIDIDAGQPGKRSTSVMQGNFAAIEALTKGLGESKAGLAGGVPAVAADETGLSYTAPIGLGQREVVGGTLNDDALATGNLSIASTVTGRSLRSTNSSDVTWTLSEDAPVGTILSWVMIGVGLVTFAASGSGHLRNVDGHFKAAGQWATGTAEVVALNGSGKAVWVLSGALQAA